MKLFCPSRFDGVRRIFLLAAIAAIGAGCTLNVDVNGPSVILKNAGDNQTAPTNTQLPEPFTVIVTNQFGQPLKNVTVSWMILSGGGSLSETSNSTVEGGASSVTYNTGPTPGTATIQAKVSGVPPVTFAVTIT